MPFPLTISGSVRFQRKGTALESAEQVGARVVASLEKASASSVTREGTTVRFTVAMFRFVSSWNILVPFDSGTLEIEDCGQAIRIRYSNSTKRLLVGVSLLCGVPLVLISTSAALNGHGLLPSALPFTFAWAWLFGGNYFVAAFRFPRWLKRKLECEV